MSGELGRKLPKGIRFGTTIRMDLGLWRQLDKVARAKNIIKNDLICQAIEEFIDRHYIGQLIKEGGHVMVFRPTGYSDKTNTEMQRRIEKLSDIKDALEEVGMLPKNKIAGYHIGIMSPGEDKKTRYQVSVALHGIKGLHPMGELIETTA